MAATDPTEGRRPGEVPPRLETRGLSVDFGRKHALDDVSLAVRAGEIIALLGDSGCGKSTLLRAVAGLEQPSGGLVLLDGQAMSARVPPEERGVGLMFQDYALFPHLTVMQNVRFGLHRLRAAEADAVAKARLEQVGLADRASSYPGSLSGGESQRVALARALAPGPRVLLLDEPFSNLDRRNRDRVRADTISVLRATGATALLVTHDPEEALLVSDRIVLMRDGRIVQIGTGADLYQRPVSRFAANFFGDLITFPSRCTNRAAATPLGVFPAPGIASGVRVAACVRPEAILLSDAEAGHPARVIRRRFLGPVAELTLVADGFTEPFRLTVSEETAVEEGDRVGLTLAKGAVLVFPVELD
ncbi:ABC transporter ATP-binding protein [Methylobacterium sp. W2]|uniref:ABC transporter ATP-binding protein n=1 Tax=Methylobacterium sp. W2 TaxID=2598107 RepID=UPI001D0CA801|nr:ABC transporter ATP-binding protein [Methylobacterium sp. W2]MCC0804741.1 ABC transporter ATP-binding protein [Methylobacterium sp. W2]